MPPKSKKTQQKNKELVVVDRRAVIAQLRLKGFAIRQITDELKTQHGIVVSHQTVWTDIKVIENTWLDRTANNMEELRIRQLEEIDLVKRNCEKFAQLPIFGEEPDDEDAIKYGIEAKDYLKSQEIILKCLDMQTRLLGVNIQKDDNKPAEKLDTEENRRELMQAILGRITVPKRIIDQFTEQKIEEKIINAKVTEEGTSKGKGDRSGY